MAVGMKGWLVAGRKRLDGVVRLTKKEKLERDARAQYWMNQRKIERVAEGAAKHGWHTMTGELVDRLVREGSTRLDDDGELIVIIKDSGTYSVDGEYRLHSYDMLPDTYSVRKIGGIDGSDS